MENITSVRELGYPEDGDMTGHQMAETRPAPKRIPMLTDTVKVDPETLRRMDVTKTKKM